MPGEIHSVESPAASPADSGVTPQQRPSKVIDAELQIADWRVQSPLSGALHELATTASQNARTTFMMAEAASRLVEEEARELRKKLRETEAKAESFEKAYYEAREENSVLKERLKTADLKTLMLALGTLALGAAVTIYLSPQSSPAAPSQIGLAHVLATFAALLILGALIVPSLRKSK